MSRLADHCAAELVGFRRRAWIIYSWNLTITLSKKARSGLNPASVVMTPPSPDAHRGVTEVAALLGLSRQRVDQLSHSDPDVPKEVVTLGRGRLWEKQAITEWARASGREIVGKE